MDREGIPGKGTVIRPYPPGCGQLFFYFILYIFLRPYFFNIFLDNNIISVEDNRVI